MTIRRNTSRPKRRGQTKPKTAPVAVWYLVTDTGSDLVTDNGAKIIAA